MGILFLITGHETTTNLINNTIRTLSENVEARDALVADPGRIAMYLEELLRYRSPAEDAPNVTNTRRVPRRTCDEDRDAGSMLHSPG